MNFKPLFCAALFAAACTDTPVARAQNAAPTREAEPAPLKSPEAAALGFYEFLASVREQSVGPMPYVGRDAIERMLASVGMKQLGAFDKEPQGNQALLFLATQALGPASKRAKTAEKAPAIRTSATGEVFVEVAPATGVPTREVVVRAEKGGFRVNIKATYGRWNSLSGPQLDRAWLRFTGLKSESEDPLEERLTMRRRRANCQTNMQQMMLGVIQYEQDHDEQLPPADKWMDAIMPYSFVRSEQVFQCPSLVATNPKGYGYAWNQNLSRINLAAVENSVQTVAIYETSNPSRNWFGRGTGRAYRHEGGSNIAFADGHVRYFRKGEEKGVSFKP